MKDLSDFCPEFQEAAAYYASLNTPSDQAILVEFLRETQDIFGCIPNDAKEQIASIMQVKACPDRYSHPALSESFQPDLSKRKLFCVREAPAAANNLPCF